MNALTRIQFLYLDSVRLNRGSVYPGTNGSEEYAAVILRVEVTSGNLTIEAICSYEPDLAVGIVQCNHVRVLLSSVLKLAAIKSLNEVSQVQRMV